MSEAKRQGTLEAELKRLRSSRSSWSTRSDTCRSIPRPNLMFSLVSNRYEGASMIVISKPFSKWGEIFGDDMAATAMIDRLIHHAEIVSTNGTQA